MLGLEVHPISPELDPAGSASRGAGFEGLRSLANSWALAPAEKLFGPGNECKKHAGHIIKHYQIIIKSSSNTIKHCQIIIKSSSNHHQIIIKHYQTLSNHHQIIIKSSSNFIKPHQTLSNTIKSSSNHQQIIIKVNQIIIKHYQTLSNHHQIIIKSSSNHHQIISKSSSNHQSISKYMKLTSWKHLRFLFGAPKKPGRIGVPSSSRTGMIW